MTSPRRRTGLAMAILPAVAALTLAACGGGGGGGGGPVVKKQFIEVEDTVSPSPANLSGFVVSQTPSYVLGLVGADATGGSEGYRGKGVTVAVLDGEFDVDHPDLSSAFKRNSAGHVIGRNVREGHDDVRPIERRIATPRQDAAGSAAPPVDRQQALIDIKQRAETEWNADFSREISHGTHVAGIIGARNNERGTVGVAPEATIIPIVLFRDYHIPSIHRPWGNLDPADAAYDESNRRVAEALAFARAQDAFVINNSWGRGRRPYEVVFRRSARRYLLPNYILRTDYRHSDIFHANTRADWERAARDGRAIVFSAGNDGWNSQTGRIKIFDQPINFNSRGANRHVEFRHTRGLSVNGEDIPANIPSMESSYFLTSNVLRGSWLAVVNVTKQRVISRSSNGWTPSEVYGHGLVNLARALQPIGPTRAAAADAFGIAPTADTRVAFSAAFGDAA
ncbi:MAG: S8 family serine peptidase, partial [Pseudomonadota bacterium]|nr:S8 family serine peptidase [Pseudomonadota bacterium]